jgi:hypothetical protein
MKCPFCDKDYILKEKWISKNCICDDEERFIKYEDWYVSIFNADLQEIFVD